jgi:quercetin dioxygenase-like cupin family protein
MHRAPAVERELPGGDAHAYLDGYIVKPWGHELRIYDDRRMDVWRLAVEPGKSTSLHAHPRKDTCLICIGGEAVLTTGASEEISLVDGSVVHIERGALHATYSERGVALLEVDLPRDKLDLVRVGDRYGRVGEPYEDADASQPEPCPLVLCQGGPPQARLRRYCATGSFRFALERGSREWSRSRDFVAGISLDARSVLDRELIVLGGDALSVNRTQTYLTVRSNHR